MTGRALYFVVFSFLVSNLASQGNSSDSAGTGIITARLNSKQLKTWKAMERIMLARDDDAGQPLRPILHDLYNWAKTTSVPISIEMRKAESQWAYAAGECVFERERDPGSNRPAAVTILLHTTVIDKAPGKRMPGERGFVPFEGLTGEERYCETLAHELAHVRQSVTEPEFFELTDRQKSLNDELLRLLPLRLLPANRQSATDEMRAIAERLVPLTERIEGPAIAVEQEVWRELRVR